MSASMSTEVDLANAALVMLGQQTISDLTDNNNRAKMVNQRLADVRDSVLASHSWNCASRRAKLSTPTGTTPAYGYTNEFLLPSDLVRLVGTEIQVDDYKIESDASGNLIILSDNDTVSILYIYKLTNVAKMSHTLQQAIATRLAAEIAVAVTGDAAKENAMYGKYQQVLADAKWEDSSQHSTTETIGGGMWIEAHSGSEFYRGFPEVDASGKPI